MPPLSRLKQARAKIEVRLDQNPSPVFRHTAIAQLFEAHRDEWRLPKNLRLQSFVEFLLEHTKLTRTVLAFPSRSETLYTWGHVSQNLLLSAVKPRAYISHRTAAVAHGLADAAGDWFYVNQEQKPLPNSEQPLLQQRLDAAFRRPQRLTANIAPLDKGQSVCLLNGKHTNRLGVVEMPDEHGRAFPVTGLERTLIDLTVRPSYAGGPSAVLDAYRRAGPKLSPERLRDMLQAMDFMYPYHQAVGFYLEIADACNPQALNLFRTPAFSVDFYLAHAMVQTRHVALWRLHVPLDL